MVPNGSDTNSGSRPSFDEQWAGYLAYLRESAQIDPRAAFSSLLFHHRWRITRWTLEAINFSMETMMARGKQSPSRAKDTKNGYSTVFVDIPIGNASHSDIVAEFGGSDALTDAIENAARSGYRIGVSYNSANDTLIASMTCRAEGDPNEGCTLSAFAGDWVSALQVLMYKHYVIAEQKWRDGSEKFFKPTFG